MNLTVELTSWATWLDREREAGMAHAEIVLREAIRQQEYAAAHQSPRFNCSPTDDPTTQTTHWLGCDCHEAAAADRERVLTAERDRWRRRAQVWKCAAKGFRAKLGDWLPVVQHQASETVRLTVARDEAQQDAARLRAYIALPECTSGRSNCDWCDGCIARAEMDIDLTPPAASTESTRGDVT